MQVAQAQRFLAAHVQVNTIFRPRRYRFSATSCRHARSGAHTLRAGYALEMTARKTLLRPNSSAPNKSADSGRDASRFAPLLNVSREADLFRLTPGAGCSSAARRLETLRNSGDIA